MYSKAEKKKVTQDEDSNYNFKLKCMAAVGAVLIATGIVATIALTATAKAATVGVAVGASAVVFSPIVSLIGLATLILASACILPLLFSDNNTYVVHSGPRTGYWGGRGCGQTLFVPSGGFGGHSNHHNNHHGHGGGGIFGGSNNHHGHGGGGIFGGSNNHHGHGDGGIFGGGNNHHDHGGGGIFGGGNNHHGHR